MNQPLNFKTIPLVLRNQIPPGTAARKLLPIALAFTWFTVSPTAQAQTCPTSRDGSNNTATGANTLVALTTGIRNTAIGFDALNSNTNGSDNTATGAGALHNNNASDNTADGYSALSNNTTGTQNTATGFEALLTNNASNNTATGEQALNNNTSGNFNTATGLEALFNNNGNNNTATGEGALFNNTTSGNNTALGYLAGENLTIGSNNIDIGANVLGVAGESNKIRIGKQGTQNGTFIAGISGVAVTGSAVLVNSSGKLGVMSSSAHFKEAIKPMDMASEAILALQPVTFRYKKELDPERIPQFGLVAEEVEKVNPDLVARDEQGKVYTVRYEAVNAMLLNEFLKEHKKVEELQRQLDVLTATVQKVSDRFELSKPASQTVVDTQ
jgi:hypothetical protein